MTEVPTQLLELKSVKNLFEKQIDIIVKASEQYFFIINLIYCTGIKKGHKKFRVYKYMVMFVINR